MESPTDYKPKDPPADPKQMGRWAFMEYRRIQIALKPDFINLPPLAVEPARPRAGDVVYADGTNWNPGPGEGLYRYSIAGAWVFIG